jgi:hypothetical protein
LREGDELGFYFKQNATQEDLIHEPSGAPVNDSSDQK